MSSEIFDCEENERLDIFLSFETSLSRSHIKKEIEGGKVKVNGEIVLKSGYFLKDGDRVEFSPLEAKELDITPCNIPLDVIYDDEDIAVINKPQGMVVHPAESYDNNDTLVNALLFRYKNLSGINGEYRRGIVHRIDKNTSGLLVIAKNDEAHLALQEQIACKRARRIYIGLVDGNIKEDEGAIEQPILRAKKDRKKMAVDKNGRYAKTFYKVLERFGDYTLVRFELFTGRTHQIRVHAKFLSHPVVGDDVYGGSMKLWKWGQLLHAKELILTHPISKEEMHFECPLPKYFEDILEKLRKTNKFN